MSLDEFEPAQQPSAWTDEFEFTWSVFRLSNIPIRCYLTNVKLSALERCFELVEDIPGSADWGYNAIFQRDIDEDRVRDELLRKYLLNPRKFKFFNPLTIALLPYDAKDKQIKSAYPRYEKDCNDPKWLEEEIGGILVRSRTNTTVGYIKWNRDNIVGVAIDGQHRLMALMEFANHPDRPNHIDPATVQIPVVLLVFDPEAGDILQQVREIFVDINKNAKPVTEARRILLDDRDPLAVFARDLVKDTPNGVGLRYEIVDWKKDTPKAEAEHQLTTIVILYEIVKSMFSTPRILEGELDLNMRLREEKLQIMEKFHSFDLSDLQLKVALEVFRASHKQFIVRVFEGIEPFSHFIQKVGALSEQDGIAGRVFREYVFKPPKKRESYKTELNKARVDVEAAIETPLTELRQLKARTSGAEILFLSIGQRALFSHYHQVARIYTLLGFDGFEAISREYCFDINCLIRNGFFARTFSIDRFLVWEGLCLRQGTILVSKASVERIGGMTLLAIAAKRLECTSMNLCRVERRVNLRKAVKNVVTEYTKQWEWQLEKEAEAALNDELGGEFEVNNGENTYGVEQVKEISRKNAVASLDSILARVNSWNNAS